ncbi:cold shock domain-containing protein [Photobacterium leiognathi]|uniref:cold shock domain-containing protein n=1 Tax=Photobacterium leiognathi TaxID=553611 RepID=UPI002981F4C8|nr:cold shock domain-containing protein [Photobacterium leiognathi]
MLDKQRKPQTLTDVEGSLRWFDNDKGFGFVEATLAGKNVDVFFHWTDIKKRESIPIVHLQPKEVAKFDLTLTSKGKLRASNVVLGVKEVQNLEEIQTAFMALWTKQQLAKEIPSEQGFYAKVKRAINL